METKFDILVIGGGPGGYVAAIRGAQLGFKIALVEKRDTLGGTCLNVGCIPSKALLDSSEAYHLIQHKAEVHGIKVGDVSVDISKMMARKEAVVSATTKGIDYLIKKNKITRFQGIGTFLSPTSLRVTDKAGNTTELTADRIIIATGSIPTPFPLLPTDGKRIITSNEALSLTEIPSRLTIIGGGVIGLELGSVYARLGTAVSIVEYLPAIVPGMDKELTSQLQKSLEKLGIRFYLGTKVTGGAYLNDTTVYVDMEPSKGGKSEKLESDLILVAIGRQPYFDGLGLERVGITPGPDKRLPVNDHFQTTIPSIFAIGDIIKGLMIAHKASEEAVACIELIAGQKPHLNYQTIPGVIYTWPEAAAVGATEEQLKQDNRSYKIGKFPFKASGRARAAEESEGFVKVLADADTDEVLGIHILGPRAADMIGEAVLAMEYKASSEDIARLTHAHPTYSEALKEAALAVGSGAIHL